MILPYWLLYSVGFKPWEGRPMPGPFRRVIEGPEALPAGRALDVGCGTGPDTVLLAKRGWRVTGVDAVDGAIAQAEQRATREGVDVQWIRADVSELASLGLEPGYQLLYDFGCIQGLPDAARAKTVDALTRLAAPGAALIFLAFRSARRLVLPRGMDQEDITALCGDAWRLVEVEPLNLDDAPAPIRRAGPTTYRLTRTGVAGAPPRAA